MDYANAWRLLKQDLKNTLKLGKDSGYTNEDYDFEFPKGCYHAYQHILDTMEKLEVDNDYGHLLRK